LRALYETDEDAVSKMAGNTLPKNMPVHEAAIWTAFARTLMNLDEFITRE
jgi:hypothetical protein